MLYRAFKRLRNKRTYPVLSLFEYSPFKNGSFDAVVCGFSFRDAIDFERTVSELSRILKEKGKLIIVDLGKPDNIFLRTVIGLYWRFLVPIIIRLCFGKLGRLYSGIYMTYCRYPTNREIKRILLRFFDRTYMKIRVAGGALIAIAFKPKSLKA
ncbi:hypothetical protein DRN86_00335 [Candidatus Geothermarchaeota archaeon]|nr:MAG: hypothetical protein DRN86_00335 [Candidatus Geothermarchaeota archaeon]